MRSPGFVILAIISIFLWGCNKDKQAEIIDSIKYQEFYIDHSKINNDTIFYDFDSDSKIDIVVTKYIDTLGGTIHYSGRIYSKSGKIKFTYTQIKPDYALLDTNDIITNTDEFEWLDTVKFEGGIPYIEGNASWPYGIFTDYFGFQSTTNANNKTYGWFHLEFFVLKEIAYNLTPNKAIRVGQKK
jgi:hypothetical protein